MKRNKKGFTLIELLAVIVILAIIMVIAVPQILNVINDSRKSAWKNSIKLIESSIETNSTLFNPTTGVQTYTLTTLCGSPITELAKIVDLGDIDTTTDDKKITCITDPNNANKRIFTFNGKNQFKGHSADLSCEETGNQAKCTITKIDE